MAGKEKKSIFPSHFPFCKKGVEQQGERRTRGADFLPVSMTGTFFYWASAAAAAAETHSQLDGKKELSFCCRSEPGCPFARSAVIWQILNEMFLSWNSRMTVKRKNSPNWWVKGCYWRPGVWVGGIHSSDVNNNCSFCANKIGR